MNDPPVKNKFRELNIQGCPIIGQGAASIVYRLSKDTLVKVFLYEKDPENLLRSQDLARKALMLGLPTAIPYDIVRVGELYGAVFELLNAEPLFEVVRKQPERAEECISLSTRLLKSIHQAHAQPGDMPDMKTVALGWGKALQDVLPDHAYGTLMHLLERVPVTDNVLHGDYHMKNVMLQKDQVMLIDLDTMRLGHPVFEFAAMYQAYIGFSEIDPNANGQFFGFSDTLCRAIFEETILQYFGTRDKYLLQAVTDRARLITCYRMIRRTMLYGSDTEADRKQIAWWTKELLRMLEKVDDLDFPGKYGLRKKAE